MLATEHNWPDLLSGINIIFSFISAAFLYSYAVFHSIKTNALAKSLSITLITCLMILLFIEYFAGNYFMQTFDPNFNYPMLKYAFDHWQDTQKVVEGTIGNSGMLELLIISGAIFLHTGLLIKYSPKVKEKRKNKFILLLIILIASLISYFNAMQIKHLPSVKFLNSLFIQAPETKIQVNTDSYNYNYYAKITAKANSNKKKNLVFIILESTRYDATSLGGQYNTTPYLATLAKKSFTSKHSYAVVPHTSKALVSILCGIYSIPKPAPIEAGKGKMPVKCLPNLLKSQNYKSVFFQTATAKFEKRAGLINNMGFDDFYSGDNINKKGFDKVNYFGVEDKALLPVSEKWLLSHRKNNKDEPFIASYLTLTSHHKYDVPRNMKTRNHITSGPRKHKHFNKYLNTLSYVDGFLKSLINQYKLLGLYKNTIFVIVGDHGEGFREHGRKQHDTVIYNEGLHVPLIIHAGDKSITGEFNQVNNQLDILPTALNALDFQLQGGGYTGQNLLSETFSSNPVYSRCWRANICMSMIEDNWKYIYHFGSKKEELFNLKNDSLERENQSKKEPLRRKQMKQKLLEWRKKLEKTYTNKA